MAILENAIVDRYPRPAKVRGDEEATLRPLDSTDAADLIKFFAEIPPQDRNFLKDNVEDPAVVEGWCDNIDLDRVFPLLALHNGRIVADATLHQTRTGWMSHIGKVRVVTHPDFRKQGLASAMVEELIKVAARSALQRVEAELVAEQKGARTAFGRMGFQEIAVLPQYVRDIHTKLHDLIIMSYVIHDQENVFSGD